MTFFKNNAKSIGITARVFIALVGGFILANLLAIIISYLPADNKVDGMVTGMMISFIVYAIAVIFTFSTKTALQAAVGITSGCLLAYAVIAYFTRVISS